MPNQGFVTPSRFADVMTNDKSGKGFGLTALSYADEIILGMLGVPREDITAKPLEWGKLHEPAARKRYEIENFCTVPIVEEPIIHPEFDFVCGLPDGLVSDDTIIEIKCPYNSQGHLDNIRTAKQYKQYKWQIQGYLWITGRQYCDFVSFDPRFPFDLQYSCVTIERDNETIEQLQERILLFWEIVQENYKKLLKK